MKRGAPATLPASSSPASRLTEYQGKGHPRRYTWITIKSTSKRPLRSSKQGFTDLTNDENRYSQPNNKEEKNKEKKTRRRRMASQVDSKKQLVFNMYVALFISFFSLLRLFLPLVHRFLLLLYLYLPFLSRFPVFVFLLSLP